MTSVKLTAGSNFESTFHVNNPHRLFLHEERRWTLVFFYNTVFVHNVLGGKGQK